VNSTLFSVLFGTDTGGFWMPRKASTVAGGIDAVFDYILYASVFFFVAIIVTMVYFAYKYRQRHPDQKTHPIAGNARLEWIWTLIPTIGLFVLFGFGFVRWLELTVPPGDAMEIRVNAKRWVWSFDYPRHKISNTSELIVPVGQNIKLTMISSDVLHSFYVPEFRVKRDVLPNRYTVLWFKVPNKARTRLQTVKKQDLLLENVLVRMAFAINKASARRLIANGHVQLNDEVVRQPDRKLQLDDRIGINIAPKLRKALFDLKRTYKNKVRAASLAGDSAQVAKLTKEGQAAFEKKAPAWLMGVLKSMGDARAAKDAVANAESKLRDAKENKPKGKGADKQMMTPEDQAKAVAKWTKALADARNTYKLKYKLPEWLYADRDGLDGMWGFVSDTFNVLCTEYCGKEHSRMITRVRVVSPKLFNFWLQRSLSKSPTGKQLIERYGCVSCHSSDGSPNTGPTFLGLYGRKEVVTDKKDNTTKTLNLVDTDKRKAFTEYIRESILKPQSKIVKGYENQLMPTFQGQISEQHISIISDYIKYLKPKKK
jgi:heme/copper-type cytochrome/quinol oxidase subunit 2/ribosomal protein S4